MNGTGEGGRSEVLELALDLLEAIDSGVERDVRNAEFTERRHLGHFGRALKAVDRQHPQAPGLDELRDRAQVAYRKIDLPAHQKGRGAARAGE